ncbi:hypothetical protein EGR_05773 [Echinococcus granulosus]|uniref:Uncharacterized protein n=1 Tax=Echinococcus granulosus TaxID=6210 RepID=W6V0B4_ECHGR|nr:hypothetical protein EGR_05773 [Echinococcus granulosus]EUB59419.1 hypothetical protein EGR_05773 [Echinococcus granulosus]
MSLNVSSPKIFLQNVYSLPFTCFSLVYFPQCRFQNVLIAYCNSCQNILKVNFLHFYCRGTFVFPPPHYFRPNTRRYAIQYTLENFVSVQAINFVIIASYYPF